MCCGPSLSCGLRWQERVRADRRERTAGTGSSAARPGLSATRRFVIESAPRALELLCCVGRHVHLPRLAGKREFACTVADNGSWRWSLSCSGARASRRMGKKKAARPVYISYTFFLNPNYTWLSRPTSTKLWPQFKRDVAPIISTTSVLYPAGISCDAGAHSHCFPQLSSG